MVRYSLNGTLFTKWKEEIKQNITSTNSLGAKAKNDHGLKGNFWRLEPSWKL